MPRKTYFRNLWLQLPRYKDWLRKKDDITGQCSYYAKDIDVSNMRLWDLKSHAGSKKHKSRSPTKLNNSFSFFDRGKNEKENKPTSSGQKTTNDTFIRDHVLFFAEISFVLKTVESNY